MTTLVKNTNSSFPSLFNDFFNDSVNRWSYDAATYNMPAVNIAETTDYYKIELAVPGLSKEDIKINIDDHKLTISAEKEQQENENNSNYYRKEFNYSNFKRSFTLPEYEVDEDKIEANFENGVLSMILHKREEAKPKPPRNIAIS